MKNCIQDGNRLTYSNTGTAITSGSGVLVGTKLGVAVVDIAATTGKGALCMKGVVNLPKLSTDVVAQGAALYWDDTNKRLTVTASGNTYAGYAHVAAGDGVATVNIDLNI